MASPAALAGSRILVVEDSYLIAEHVCRLLGQAGCVVVGPAPRLSAALALLERESRLDGAILDVNLNGELCFPIARQLAARGVPFVFFTGYDDRKIIPPEFAHVAVIRKPIEDDRLIDELGAATVRRPER